MGLGRLPQIGAETRMKPQEVCEQNGDFPCEYTSANGRINGFLDPAR